SGVASGLATHPRENSQEYNSCRTTHDDSPRERDSPLPVGVCTRRAFRRAREMSPLRKSPLAPGPRVGRCVFPRIGEHLEERGEQSRRIPAPPGWCFLLRAPAGRPPRTAEHSAPPSGVGLGVARDSLPRTVVAAFEKAGLRLDPTTQLLDTRPAA